MTKIDVVSGFLGAGKTTLIKKLLKEALDGSKTVLIENEFGEIGIDGGFLKEAGIEIKEMNSGCICCSLVGDFGTALKDVIDRFHPDRIVIEASGVGKLSDVVAAVKRVEDTEICGTVTVIDASKCKVYLKNFAEFYENQIKYAGTIILSRTGDIKQVSALAMQGDIKNINLLIGDISAQPLPGLPMEATASIFARAKSDAPKEDIAAGIIGMVLQTIGSASVLAAKGSGCRDMVLIGNLTLLPQCKDIFPALEKLYKVRFHIPKYAEFCTAIGAALAYKEE